MKITIDVTRDDIDAAIAERTQSPGTSIILCCPVSQAVRRQFPQQQIIVGFGTIQIGDSLYEPTEDKAMGAFTCYGSADWPSLTPGTFEITECPIDRILATSKLGPI